MQRKHNRKIHLIPYGSGYIADDNRLIRHYRTRRQVMKQYIVDAFTDKPFSGNPAAVCVMDKWPKEDFMMKLAM